VTKTPGGSSGGSAAALAAGLTGLEAGSDIGASIRNPAHYCGVFGLKPTWGVISPKGQQLPGVASYSDISVVGPMARSADDLDTALDAMAGPDEIDGVAWSVTLPSAVGPAGFVPGGLPVGYQAIAASGRDKTAIAFSRLVEREIGGFVAPKGFA
jgi:Asp-tRNA(Asn)/Glu-tRNA(Gln) amidotransferase A subunit family amidase